MQTQHQLSQEVIEAELEEINQRQFLDNDGKLLSRHEQALIDFERILLAPEKRSPVLNEVLDEIHNTQAAWDADPDVAHRGLVGLAFSGGGIRSATVNLGVIQGLRKLGLLKAVDYLSTVSGGGYIASCYSAVHAVETQQQSEHAIRTKTQTDSNLQTEIGTSQEAEKIKQIRAHDALFGHQPGVPENAVFRHLRNNANYMAPGGLIDVLRVPSVFLRGMFVNFLIVFPLLLVMAAISVLLISNTSNPRHLIASWFAQFHLPIIESFSITLALIYVTIAMYLLSPIANLLLASIKQKRKLTTGTERKNANWIRRDKASKVLGWCIAAILSSFFIELQVIAIRLYGTEVEGRFSFQTLVLFGSFSAFGLSYLASKLLPSIASLASRLTIYFLGLIGFAVFWLFYLHLCNDLLRTAPSPLLEFTWKSPIGFFTIALILFLFNHYTANVNFTSFSCFYRDRLSKAYIFGLNRQATVQQADELKLSELDSTFAPYHLLNCTLNLNRTSQAYCDDRRGDFFFFSKRYVGSVSTSYCRTEELEKQNSDLNLASAMAISAAAVAPNLGKSTIKPLVFILGMLNIRYDYWLANPTWIKHKRVVKNRPGPNYFLRELTSNLTADTAYINLSDGGHIENLGIYELIRRECRLIIAADSEEDLGLTFSSLADVIRLAQIDFGVIIVMQGLDKIRNGQQHYAIGSIYYRNEKVGKLIYLKTSLLGDFSLRDSLSADAYLSSHLRRDNFAFDHNPYIAHYKMQDPAFPHQSSANQFYDETQFECYRSLGFQIATESLGRR